MVIREITFGVKKLSLNSISTLSLHMTLVEEVTHSSLFYWQNGICDCIFLTNMLEE